MNHTVYAKLVLLLHVYYKREIVGIGLNVRHLEIHSVIRLLNFMRGPSWNGRSTRLSFPAEAIRVGMLHM